uniref:SnoaL-like domain-containing protein n=1 Tax=Trypanosoma congolense (strain IL3000) TaxID=1068625 RepID=G0UP81_TRYCI|nr:conserved hypothetical protein [Trypanosoma congolense IL3000]
MFLNQYNWFRSQKEKAPCWHVDAQMTVSQLIVTRFADLLAEGNVQSASKYLADDVVYNSWLGVVYGKDNVVVFLMDNVRFVHHGRNYNRWKQVQHTLEHRARQYDLATAGGEGHTTNTLGTKPHLGMDGYDSQGYATFERDGTIASHAKFAVFNVKIKETIVLRDNKVVLVNISKRC